MTSSPEEQRVPRRTPIRVAAVEDETYTRAGLLSSEALQEFDMVSVFGTVEEFLQAGPEVDVVVLDLWIKVAPVHLQGAAAIRAITERGYRILIHTSETRRAVLAACLGKGARGIVGKQAPETALADGIRAVAAGLFAIPPSVAGLEELFFRLKRGQMPDLTPRQLEVLRARARGERDASIASRLGISVRTVEFHKHELDQRVAAHFMQLGYDVDLLRSAADIERDLGVGKGDLLDPDL